MKKLFLLVLLLTAWLTVEGAPVSRDKAQQQVIDFVGQNARLARSIKGGQSPLSLSLAAEGRHYFVFNINGGNGFVVAAGDDRLPAILGYTVDKTFDAGNVPQNMQAWLQGVADQVDYADEHHIPLLSVPRRAEDHAPVAPMLKSKWDQGSPYNAKCPMDNETGQRSVVGCVATSMAQILNYYRYPAGTTGTITGYTTTSRQINMPDIAPTTIDWDNMLNNYSGYSTDAQKQAVAQLMLLCGCSVNIDYTSVYSGASELFVPEALIKYFGYDKTARRVQRCDLPNSEWDELIYGEVAAGRPVIYCGQSSGGGHAFVVDGYANNGYYHVNWGWSGTGDDYYLLSIVNPYSTQGIGGSSSRDGFSYYQAAVVGIMPDTGSKPEDVRLSTHGMQILGSKNINRSADGQFHASLRASMFNMTGSQHDFYIGVGVFDANGEEKEEFLLSSATLGTGWGWDLDQYPFDIADFQFGQQLPDGAYKIKMVSGEAGSDDYRANYGSNNYYIPAIIQGNTLTLANPEIKLTGTMQQEGDAVADERVNMKVLVTNEGTDFCNDVYMFAGSTFLGGRTMEADAGQTVEFYFDFTVQKGGDYPVGLYYYEDKQMKPIAETTVSVVSKGKTHLSYEFQIDNVQENNVLIESTVHGKVNLTNDGTLDYNDRVTVLLYKYNQATDTYQYVIHKEQNVALPIGDATQIDIEFSDLENDELYLLGLQYIKDDNWVDDKVYYQFWVALEQPPSPEPDNQLDIAITIEELDGQGQLHQDAVSGTIAVTNTGTIAYNDSIWTVLYKDEDSHWVACKVYEAILQLDADKSTTLNFAFEGLEDGSYAVALLYKKNSTEYQYGLKTFTVVLPPPPVPDNHLAVSFIIDNAGEKGMLLSNQVKGTILAVNDGETVYQDSIAFTLYEMVDGQSPVMVQGSRQKQFVTIQQGESLSLPFEFTGLEPYKEYVVAFAYRKNAEELVNDQSPSFYFDEEASGITSASGNDQMPVVIYSLDGRKVESGHRNELPQMLNRLRKGVYVVNGKKLRR